MIRTLCQMCTALFKYERGDRIFSRLDTPAWCTIPGYGCLTIHSSGICVVRGNTKQHVMSPGPNST